MDVSDEIVLGFKNWIANTGRNANSVKVIRGWRNRICWRGNMTRYEKYIANLTEEKFIDSMTLNCSGCPIYPCGYYADVQFGDECEKILREWCEEKCDDDKV